MWRALVLSRLLFLSIFSFFVQVALAQDTNNTEKISPEAKFKHAIKYVTEIKEYQKERDYKNDLNYAIENLITLTYGYNYEPAESWLTKAYIYSRDIEKSKEMLKTATKNGKIKRELFNFAYDQAEKAEKNKETQIFSKEIFIFLSENGHEKSQIKRVINSNDVGEIRKLAKQGNKEAEKKYIEILISQKNLAELLKLSGEGIEISTKALNEVIFYSSDLESLKKLSDSGNPRAQLKLEQDYVDAIKRQEIEKLLEFSRVNYRDSLQQVENLIFKEKKWKFVAEALPHIFLKKISDNRESEAFSICNDVLKNQEIDQNGRKVAWTLIKKMADNGHTPSLMLVSWFLFRDDLIEKYGLQNIVSTDPIEADIYIQDLTRVQPQWGFYILAEKEQRNNNFSSAYKNFEKSANYGNVKGLKNQIILISNGKGQASSETQELYLRYMAQALDNGTEEEWILFNAKVIKSMEARFTDNTIEKLKIDANLAAEKIQERMDKNQKQDKKKFRDAKSGTGFVITDSGFILTAAHVVDGAEKIEITYLNKRYQASLVSLDKANDLALLKIESGERFQKLAFSNQTPEQGAKVSTFGYPAILPGEENDVKYKSGDISSLRGINNDPKILRLNLEVEPGNSGGPLFDESKKVIGIVVSKRNWEKVLEETGQISTEISYAIKNDYIIPLLKLNKIEDQITFSDPPSKISESVVIIEAD